MFPFSQRSDHNACYSVPENWCFLSFIHLYRYLQQDGKFSISYSMIFRNRINSICLLQVTKRGLQFYLKNMSMAEILWNTLNTLGVRINCLFGGLLGINQKILFVSTLVIALYNQFQKYE